MQQIKPALRMLGGKCGDQMVSAMDPGSSSLGSRPVWGHGVVFLGKTLYFHIEMEQNYIFIVKVWTPVLIVTRAWNPSEGNEDCQGQRKIFELGGI